MWRALVLGAMVLSTALVFHEISALVFLASYGIEGVNELIQVIARDPKSIWSEPAITALVWMDLCFGVLTLLFFVSSLGEQEDE